MIFFVACTKKNGHDTNVRENVYYDRAYSLLNERKTDSAFFYFNLAKESFLETKDSLNLANCLVQMAIILTDLGDYFGGQETSLQAMDYLDGSNPKHHYYLAANFNNLGISALMLRDYQQSLRFYESAIRFSHDVQRTRTYLNNKAKSLQQLEDYPEALAIYERIVSESKDNPRDYARALTNLAVTRWAEDPGYDARPNLWYGLNIRLRESDLWGQNSSFAHLADYYTGRQPDSALYYARKRYAAARQLNSGEDLVQALQKLIQVGTPDSARHYFETYRKLKDSIQLARSAAANQFALIRYEVERNKAENLRLQRENAEKAHQMTRQRMWTTITILLAVSALLGGAYWQRKRKQRMELEAQNQIKAHQLKTSKKIHDVVANGIYRVMTEIENREEIDRERILDRLEGMYEKSRDISYETENPLPHDQDYHSKIAELLKSFATESTKIIIAGNSLQLWEHVGEQVKLEVEHILQELMVNMRKHSHATNVVVRFAHADGLLRIHYHDDGLGLPESFTKGNGLANTGNRIESLRGQITFASEAGQGLKAELVVPVS